MRLDLQRWGVFNLVGVAGFVLQIAAIAALTRAAGWTPFMATAVALEGTALVNFVSHSRWTWGDRPETSLGGWLRRYGRYQAAKTVSLAASLVMTTALSHGGLPVELANTLAVLVCAVPNFLVAERMVFTSE